MDPQIRILHETTSEAIMDAGYCLDDMRGSNTATYLGICHYPAENAQREEGSNTVTYKHAYAHQVSYSLDFRGPIMSADTACASSFSAFTEATHQIKAGVVQQAVVSGVGINLNPFIAMQFRNLQMISLDGRCKCLDESANGYCRSEAVISIFMQKRKDAKRVYATVLNARTNTDGYKTEGITFPKAETQERLMKETYSQIGLNPNDIKYMEGHITGTQAGDPVECQALTNAMCSDRTEPLLLGALKSNMGHSEGASGVCGITKACLAFQRGELPPNLFYKTPNPKIEGLVSGKLKPVTEAMKFDEDVIGLNSFGFGEF